MKADLIGKRFGRLVVISETTKTSRSSRWFCHCDCGNTCEVNTGALTGKEPCKSCGCLRDEIKNYSPMCLNHPDRVATNKGRRLCGTCINLDYETRNPHKKAERLLRNRQRMAQQYTEKNPEEHAILQRVRRLKHRYGMTMEDYNVMLENQKGVCKICGKAPSSHPLYVDHCHITNVVRGLLCAGCNTAVGQLVDKGHNFLNKLFKYVQSNQLNLGIGTDVRRAR